MKRNLVSRVGTMLLLLALIVGVASASWWASRATLTSALPESSLTDQADEVIWAQASTGAVGRSLLLSTTLRQPALPVAVNHLAGVVTGVQVGQVDSGDIAFVVADTPVRILQVDTPFWRDLSRPAQGDDVRAVQEFLIAQGHLTGVADGDFGAASERAVKAWQKQEGRTQTGIIALGEFIAVPQLPTTIHLGEQIVLGHVVTGGEEAVLAPTGERAFVMVVTQEQARLIPTEATVRITHEELTWEAVIAATTQDQYGSVELILAAPDGGEVCGTECDRLPDDAQATLRSEVVIVPEVAGTTVPAAALRTRADGTAYLETKPGDVDVQVLGSGQGVAVVEGIEAGAQVALPAGGSTGIPAPTQTSPSGDQEDDSRNPAVDVTQDGSDAGQSR